MNKSISLVVDGKPALVPDELDSTTSAPPGKRAIFDATCVRMRRVPITPERMKAALASV